jgi:hypothetical protein
MPAAYGEDHPDFMRVDHAQLAEDCRALKREKAAVPNGGSEAETRTPPALWFYSLPDRVEGRGSEERALKDLAFFGEWLLPQCASPAMVLRTAACSRQRPGL